MPGFEENLQNLVAWARDGVTHDPNRLFRAIVMQFLSEDHPPAPEDRPNLLKILKDIRPKVDLTLRQDLARQFAKYARPPSDLVRVFADDDIAVARIVLETSGGLSDQDLIEIGRNGTVAHRQAIVMRRGLSPAVRIAVFGAGIESDKTPKPTETPTPAEAEAPIPLADELAPTEADAAEAEAHEQETAEHEADEPVAETASETEEAGSESAEPSALSRLDMALNRHGRRPIQRDFERAKDFLDKIQSIRTPPQRASLLERAGQPMFSDSKSVDEEEPKSEDVARAEAFLAEIGQKSNEALDEAGAAETGEPPIEAVATEEEPSVAAPEPEAMVKVEPEPELVPEPGPEPEAPAETAQSETSPAGEEDDESVLELTEEAILEPEDFVIDEIVKETATSADETTPEPVTAETPEETRVEEADAVATEAETAAEPEPEETVEPAPEKIAAAAPRAPEQLPEGELLVAGDLFQKNRSAKRTARRLADLAEREQDYARSAVDWTWETDYTNLVTFLSEGAGQALGVSESRILNKPLNELGHFTGEGLDPRKAKEAMSRRIPYRDQVFETITDAGLTKSWRMTAVPVFELRSGRFRGYRGAARAHGGEVGDRARQAEETEALAETVKEVEVENRELASAVQTAKAGISARTDRIASVSHELRTPLNAIMGFSDAMASETFGPLSNQYREYAKDILTSASEVNQIINDVLDKSKLEAGAMTMSVGPVPLMMLLEQARADIEPEAASREMDLEYAVTKTDLVLKVDADHAQRVVTTVLRSAVRFGRKGGRIGIEALVDRPGVAQINIWNDGPALAAETIAAMLPPMPEEGQPEEEPQVGLGLTLAVARGLARLMEGDVMLQSKEGVGNRFIIELPVDA